VQLKGSATALGPPTPADLAATEEHLAAFVGEVVQLGIAPARARRLEGDELLAAAVPAGV
jgi:hypothetical protein